MGAGRGTHGQNAPDIQKHHRDRRLRNHADIQHGTRRTGKCGSKCLPRSRIGQNMTVPPDILLNCQNVSRQHKTYGFRRISGMHKIGFLREARFFRIKAGENCGKLCFRNTGEQLRGTDNG